MSDATSLPTLSDDDLGNLAERVDDAFAELQQLDADAQTKAKALKSAVEAFHKVGLTAIVKKLKEDPRGKELLFELVDDPTVYALFAMHGLVRADLRTQVSRVLEMVRPYLQSHGGDVHFVDIKDKEVLVRLDGACNGCSMSSVTVRNTVEEALKEHVPDVQGVVVLEPEPEPAGFVALESLSASGPGAEQTGWMEGPALSDLAENQPHVFDAGNVSVVFLKLGGEIRAFRNQCAHQGLPIDGGMVDAEQGTITCPWHGWCFDGHSGECLTAPQAQLEQFPSRVQDQHVWVRPQ